MRGYKIDEWLAEVDRRPGKSGVSDIVKQLRATTPKDSGYAELANAAADEIERLRRAVVPFAINCDFYKPEVPHYEMMQIPMQYLRAARAALPGGLPSVDTIL